VGPTRFLELVWFVRERFRDCRRVGYLKHGGFIDRLGIGEDLDGLFHQYADVERVRTDRRLNVNRTCDVGRARCGGESRRYKERFENLR
jgi:hypothetical protein